MVRRRGKKSLSTRLPTQERIQAHISGVVSSANLYNIGARTCLTFDVSWLDVNTYPTKSSLESETTGSLPNDLKRVKRETARILRCGHGDNFST